MYDEKIKSYDAIPLNIVYDMKIHYFHSHSIAHLASIKLVELL